MRRVGGEGEGLPVFVCALSNCSLPRARSPALTLFFRPSPRGAPHPNPLARVSSACTHAHTSQTHAHVCPVPARRPGPRGRRLPGPPGCRPHRVRPQKGVRLRQKRAGLPVPGELQEGGGRRRGACGVCACAHSLPREGGEGGGRAGRWGGPGRGAGGDTRAGCAPGLSPSLLLTPRRAPQTPHLPSPFPPQRYGVKVYGGQPVKAGGIIVRQLGTQVSGTKKKRESGRRRRRLVRGACVWLWDAPPAARALPASDAQAAPLGVLSSAQRPQ